MSKKPPPAWPASNPETRKVAELVPSARNARKHSDEQVGKIARSIREFGWTNPVLIKEDGTILAGHGRVLAAERLDILEVPVIVARGWSEAQCRAYVIADNKIALEAGWDREALTFELEALSSLDFDVTLTGFDLGELAGGEEITKVDVPRGVNFVWALVGVPIASMGKLQAMIDAAQSIEGSVVEVSDDFVNT